jgi:glutaconate CoA-transferase subunit A
MGVPYIPVRGLAGTDVFERRPDMMLAPNPFDPDEVTVVAEAQNPDVAILHGLKADKEGNAILRRFGEDVMVAQASRRTIVTVEEIVDRVTPEDTSGQFISSVNVTAVVHAPLGAHPTAVPGLYERDDAHIQRYMEASVSDREFSRYLDMYVYGTDELTYRDRFAAIAAK